ncbi:hypothetical protein PENTCL1PPCAC_6153 [Pristionchus entomophagus]|uniref:SET domain-containing protein n=1 Tax=Pristionchus entomophagus TaxID=358040 RepID=A0AAV5SPD5_9BILA|nr:hypothetical protein PENTCL1PPCAC_6153 [Pristionchus entomophagus]
MDKSHSSKKRETRKEKKQREGSVDSGQTDRGKVVSSYKCTFTVPARQKNYLRHCCFCNVFSKSCPGLARAKSVKKDGSLVVEEEKSDSIGKYLMNSIVNKESDENGENAGAQEKKEIERKAVAEKEELDALRDILLHIVDTIVSSESDENEENAVGQEKRMEMEEITPEPEEKEEHDPPMVVKKKWYENGEEDEGQEEKKKKREMNATIKCAIDKCTQRMHKSCVEDFTCSEYSPEQAQLLFNAKGPVCPAHFCWNCYDERCKNASRFGELADCEKCMRSFHPKCVPAGCKITNNGNGKRKTFVCHYHASSKGPKISLNMRLKHCTECWHFEEDEDTRVECKGCTSMFHKNCGYREIKGNGPNGEDFSNGYCTFCLVGAVIVPGQMVLAYSQATYGLKAGNYPAEAKAISDIPPHIANQLGPNLGKPGWIPVKWIWIGNDTPFYNMVHKSQVQRVTQDCEKNLADEEFLTELRKCENRFTTPTVPLDNEEMRKTITIINENVCIKGVKFVRKERTIDVCSCKAVECGTNKVKCNTSDCDNRRDLIECGKDCGNADKGIICANRSLQENPEERAVKNYEVRLAPFNKGFGLFATQAIKRDEFICEYVGEIIDKEEKERREARIEKLLANDESTYLMSLPNGLTVDARFKGGDARYINHSCDPNAVVSKIEVPMKYLVKGRRKDKEEDEKALYEMRMKVEALRKIEVDEEITFDYDLQRSRNLDRDNCRCGSTNCKGKLGKKTKEDEGDERFDKNDLLMELDEEEDEDKREDAEKENKGEKGTLTKKAAKSVEMKNSVKKTKKRERRISLSPSPGPSTSRSTPKRRK